MKMTLTPQSSNIKSYGYDPEKKTLQVEFKSGTYTYHDVPEDIATQLALAPSVGSFIFKNVKGKFEHKKHDLEKPPV